MFIQDDEFDNIDSILDESIKEAENAYDNMMDRYVKQRQIVKYEKFDLFSIVYLHLFTIFLKANLFLKLFF
tara:strand:- start:157 stop:369 length:213 start_codon:yes stop_codon:yes gene_type:complete